MKKTVYILGNTLLPSDSLPIRLLFLLRKKCPTISFERLDPTEEIEIDKGKQLILIDSVAGIDKVTVFHDLSYFAFSPRVTVHDYDLPVNLGLLQKLKKVKKITIIGVPQKGKLQEILKEVIDNLYIHLTFRK